MSRWHPDTAAAGAPASSAARTPATPGAPGSVCRDATQRIAVFRALQLGDMLCAMPALRALRKAWQQAHISLIGLPWAGALLDRYPALFDELLVFPGAPGFPEQDESGAGLADFYRQARARRFDLAIQLHGSGGIANDILFRLGARHHAGFTDSRDGRRAGCFMPWPSHLPEVLRYVALMRRLGVDVGDESLYLPLHAADWREREELVRARGIQAQRAVIVHAGSQLPSRRWPAERFAAVADALAQQGLQILLTGTAAEAALVQAVMAVMKSPAIGLAGQTSLGGLAALMSGARLVLCNDTSLSHMAAALKVPSVVVACGSDTARWAPLDRQRHRVLADYPACRPCDHPICPYEHACARNVEVTAVLAACRAQLGLSEERPLVALGHPVRRPSSAVASTPVSRTVASQALGSHLLESQSLESQERTR